MTNKTINAKLSQTTTKGNKMLLTLAKYGDTFEVYDLDDPNSIPVAYFAERHKALAFMKKHEKKRLTNIRW